MNKFVRAGCLLVFFSLSLVGADLHGATGEKMTEAEVLQQARNEEGGFLGTWVRTIQRGDYWYLFASSKSAKPPGLYIFNALTRQRLFKAGNSASAELTGTAKNGADGPLVLLAKDLPVACPCLNKWPDSVVGKTVRVTGALKKMGDAETKSTELPLLEIDAQKYHLKGGQGDRK